MLWRGGQVKRTGGEDGQKGNKEKLTETLRLLFYDYFLIYGLFPSPFGCTGPRGSRLTSVRFLTGSSSLWGYWNALIEILSLQSQAGWAPRVPLGRQQERLRRAVAVAHCEQGAPLSAGRLGAFFLFVFLCCGSGSFPLAAPASSGCVPPAAKGKSRISRAHCGKGHPERLGAKPET